MNKTDFSRIGRIAPVFIGGYSQDETYKKLDIVLYELSLWLALQDTTGNAPPGIPEDSDLTQPIKNDYWQLYIPGIHAFGGGDFVSKTDIAQAPTEASEGKLGISKPDGKTITIDQDGTLHGASLDFVGTAAELKAAITDGSVKAGMTAFIKDGKIDGNGMLVEVAEGSGMSMIGKIEDGNFTPYASMGDKQLGVPLFVFDNKEEWQAAYDEGNVPDLSVIILLEDEEGTGSAYVVVDGELSLESENPVQNKVIAQEFENVKAMRGSETDYGMVKLSAASDVTDSTGLAVPASELNAALEGSLANRIAKADSVSQIQYNSLASGINFSASQFIRIGNNTAIININMYLANNFVANGESKNLFALIDANPKKALYVSAMGILEDNTTYVLVFLTISVDGTVGIRVKNNISNLKVAYLYANAIFPL